MSEDINWYDDKLDRKASAEFLTKYLLNKYSSESTVDKRSNFILNINADWGYGKTYFLNNWGKDLSDKGHLVIKFDAWENDFSNNALLSFIYELEQQLQKYLDSLEDNKTVLAAKKSLAEFTNTILEVLKKSAPTALAAMATLLTGTPVGGTVKKVIEAGVSETDKEIEIATDKAIASIVSEAAKQTLQEHHNTKTSINHFSKKLAKLIEHIDTIEDSNLPIFIMVDELDRCRPNFAIELLENIKHLFNVPGVYFIIATATNQLCSSIKSIYGSEFEAERYLKRFFDQEFSLLQPSLDKFSNFLVEQYGYTKEYQKQNLHLPIDPISGDEPSSKLSRIFSIMAKHFKLGLRDQEQCFFTFDAFIKTYRQKVHTIYLLFLIFLKHRDTKMFNKYLESNSLDFFKGTNFFDPSICFRLPGMRYQHNPEPIPADIIYKVYIDLNGKTFTDLNSQTGLDDFGFEHAIANSLQSDLPNAYPTDEPKVNLNNYHNKVTMISELK